MSSMFGIFLVVLFTLVNTDISQGVTELKYGCPYANGEFTMESRQEKEISYCTKVNALYLSNMEIYKEFIDSVTKIYREFVANHLYNSVDNIHNFYLDYLQSGTTKPFPDFFNSYKVLKFVDESPEVVFAYPLLDSIVEKMSNKFPKISDRVYLAHVLKNLVLSKDEFNELNSRSVQKESLTSVMPVIKFYSPQTMGYILFDINHSSEPIIVNQISENPEELTVIHTYKYSDMLGSSPPVDVFFKLHTKRTDFITAKLLSSNNKDKVSLLYLIDAHLPYCTPWATEKYNFIQSDRYLTKRNEMGKSIAGIAFNVFPLDVENKSFLNVPSNKVAIFTHNETFIEKQIDVQKLTKTNPVLENSEQTLINEVADILGIKRETMLHKIQSVAKMISSKNFTENIYKLFQSIKSIKNRIIIQ